MSATARNALGVFDVNQLTAPLCPPQVDLRDFPFIPVDVGRLFDSEFHAVTTDGEWRAGVTLWFKAWHQVPAGSLPESDIALARLAEFGRDLKGWRAVKDRALHGWVKCSDGRLYHKTVCEKALEGWLEKLNQRKSSAHGNAKKQGKEFDPAEIDAQIEEAASALQSINPASRSLRRRTPAGKPDGGPGGKPGGKKIPPENTPAGKPDGGPGGKPDDTPTGPQGTGTGTGTGISPLPTGSSNPSAAADSARRKAHAKPPPADLIEDVFQEIRRLSERWFDEIDRHPHPADDGIVAVWLESGGTVPVIAAAVGEQFERLAGKHMPCPASLRMIDRDVLSAIATAKPAPAGPRVSDEIVQWRARLKGFRGGSGLWLTGWGPRPGEDGCEVPAGVLAEFQGERVTT